MTIITYGGFERVGLISRTIVKIEEFPKIKKQRIPINTL
jgi:hypothetical protein